MQKNYMSLDTYIHQYSTENQNNTINQLDTKLSKIRVNILNGRLDILDHQFYM